MARWTLPFTTISPRHLQATWEVGVHESKIRVLRNSGHETAYARLMLVQKVLADPLTIFEGWSRPDKEDCYVYAGDPGTDFRSYSLEMPAPPNCLFLVFILENGTIDH